MLQIERDDRDSRDETGIEIEAREGRRLIFANREMKMDRGGLAST